MSVQISGMGGTYRLRVWHERAHEKAHGAADEVGVVPIDLRGDAAGASALVRALARAPGAIAGLRHLLDRELFGAVRLDDDEVVRRLAIEISAGRVLVVRVAPPVLRTFDVLTGEEAEPIAAERAPRQEKTWIEIELVDAEGKPVPNERYWILLPDGSAREGRLNAEGRAYFGDLDPGECDVRFPDLDNDAVAAPREPARPDARPLPPKPRKTWIEIELTGMDGGPVPNEAYRIALPDGTAIEGRLNERGRARVSGIDPGTCTVTFPELDMEAWEPLAP